MKLSPLFILSACLVAATAAADDKWEVTTAMEVTGMPFQMPANTQTVCVPPGEQNNQKMIPADKNCKVSNFSTSGSTSRFHIDCSAPQKMSGDGEITRLGKDAYKGTLKAKGDFDGQAAEVRISYAGRKLGSCAASESTSAKVGAMQAQAAAMQAQSDAAMKQACQKMATDMSWQAAGSPSMDQMCPTLKTDICRRFSQQSATPDSLRGLRQQHEDWADIASFCGKDPEAMKAAACQSAKQKKVWDAAIDFCGIEDPELEAVANENCAGLDFTSMKPSDKRFAMAPLCDRYAKKARASQGGGVMDTGKKALDGLNKLRGLFGK